MLDSSTTISEPAAVPIEADWVSPTRTALCIIDVQNDFAHPNSPLAEYGIDMQGLAPTLSKINELISAARAAGVPIVFVGLQTSPEKDSPAWKLWMQRQGKDADAESAICRQGEWGEAFYACLPEPQDKIIHKTRYSAFWQTELNTYLQQQGVDTLVVAGITTECCVESTVRDAFHHDYQVIVAKDASAAYDDALHYASLQVMATNFALLANSDNIISHWEK
jgi:ureidoacrylate peracid hydrolase